MSPSPPPSTTPPTEQEQNKLSESLENLLADLPEDQLTLDVSPKGGEKFEQLLRESKDLTQTTVKGDDGTEMTRVTGAHSVFNRLLQQAVDSMQPTSSDEQDEDSKQ